MSGDKHMSPTILFAVIVRFILLLALNGNQRDAWGTVTQGAVLKGALEAAESRDR